MSWFGWFGKQRKRPIIVVDHRGPRLNPAKRNGRSALGEIREDNLPWELELYVGRNILWDQILPWDPSIHFRMVFQMFFFLWSRFPKHNFGWEVCGVKNPWRCKSNQIGCLQRVCAVMMWKSFVATLCPQIWFTLSPVRRGGLYMWVLQSLANAAHMSNEKKLVV